MKIYTGFGDKGKTRLFGGEVVDKDNLRVKAYGTMDELNSTIGILISYLDDKDLIKDLQNIQYKIFELSAELAAKAQSGSNKNPPAINEEIIKGLEDKIDRIDDQLESLKNFILPGGSRQAAISHLIRTVCRRGERELISLNHVEQVNDHLLIYVNRLSDYFFVLARLLNKENKTDDIPWISK